MRSRLLLCLMLPVFAFAQQNAELLQKASRLYDSNYNMDFEPIADLTYPEVVEQLGGREAFTEKLDRDYQNDKFRKRLQLTSPIFQLGPEKTIGERRFRVLSYRNPTRYFYERKLTPDEMQREVDAWKKTAATKEVFAEPNRNSINVKRVSRFVGVMDGSTDGQWKFFDLDDADQLSAFNRIFPAETRSQLGL